jgi:hypothetical protein
LAPPGIDGGLTADAAESTSAGQRGLLAFAPAAL